MASDKIKAQTNYAITRLFVGSIIGFVVAFLIGYLIACYNNDISIKVGIRIFRYPVIGLGLTVISFGGAVVGAIASMFSKRWNEIND